MAEPVTTGDKTMNVGVTLASNTGKFATNGTEAQKACFTSDNSDYAVNYNNNSTPDNTADDYLELVTSYAITVDSGLTNGSITVASSAYSGEAVTLTVTPNSGYQLKANSLKVNDGAISIAGMGGGEYTFTMPAADATVTAEFEEIVLPYFFDFESDFIAAGWTHIDADDDGHTWVTGTNNYGDQGWGVDGSYCAVSQSYDSTLGAIDANNWLFSPAFTIPADGATINWFEKSHNASYPDSYTVYVGETVVAQEYDESTAPNGMKVLYAVHAADNPWKQISVELSGAEYGGKTVYIAFQHKSNDCCFLEIDNFAISPIYGITNNAPQTSANDNHGYLAVASTADAGETVTVTVNPNEGYTLTANSLKVIYTDSNAQQQPLTPTKGQDDNTYTFEMPESNVTIKATFKEVEKPTANVSLPHPFV